MNKNARTLLLMSAMLIAWPAAAQDVLEEYFYASGKIRVVVAVASTVLAGLLVYLFLMDRRLKKLEEKERR